MNNTKSKILEVSLELFSQKGFSATSIRQIAREVGVRESAVYNHFKSKDDILSSLFLEYGAEKTRAEMFYINDFNEVKRNPYEFFKTVVERMIEYFKSEQSKKYTKIIMMEIFKEDSATKEIIKKELFVKARDMAKEIFQQMIENSIIKEQDTLLLANELLAPLFFLNIEYLILEADNEDESHIWNLLRKHIDFFWNAIKME